MFKTSSKKVLLSLFISSVIIPTFASSPLENYIDQTINRQNPNAQDKSIDELLAMSHYDRHTALTNMLDTIQVGADKNNVKDLFLLGYYYYSEAEDNKKEEDYHKAKEYFTQAEKRGSKDAMYLLGELYYYGEGVSQDYLKAAQYYEKAAALKQKEAIFSLGSLYMNGLGFDENPQKALEYYHQAAKLNHNTSINTLGYYYETGGDNTTEVDLAKAATWYQKSCDNGDNHGCDAINRLKIHTLDFKSVLAEIIALNPSLQNSSKELPNLSRFTEADEYEKETMLENYFPEILTKASDYEVDGIFLLGLYYHVKGDNNYDDYAYGQAKILFEEAIKLGSADAIYELAELYYYGNGVEQDYEKSLMLYSDPKLATHAEAIFSQAVQYDSGEGVEKDYEKSFELFNKAAELGHAPSTFNVGYMYEYGEFVDIDLEEAKKWYQKACDYNYSDGCSAVDIIDRKISGEESSTDTELDSLFNEIMGNNSQKSKLELTSDSILNADHDEAREFLKTQTDLLLEKVKNENDVESLFLTGYLFYLEGLENSNNNTYAQSYALMEKAADQGFNTANFYLAAMNFHGEGVDQDYQKAREYLEKTENHPEALFYLATIYDEGLGVPQDQEKSFSLYQKAAQLGHSDSTYNVGFMYHYGEFVEADEVEAQKWYQKACELGDMDGCEESANLSYATEAAFTYEDGSTSEKERNPIEGGVTNFFEGVLDILGPK